METWNFRIVHIAGATALRVPAVFRPHVPPDRDHRETRILTLLAALLAIPALVAGVTAIGFVNTIAPANCPRWAG
jgi:hypothetical protein